MRFAMAILACALAMPAEDNRLTAEEKAAGWELLFDGKSGDGWLEIAGAAFPSASWTIDAGCLKVVPNPDGNQDIRTKAVYGSYEFRFDWKVEPAGNSGVKYLLERIDKWASKSGKGYQARARGPEYQLTDDAANKDALSSPKRSAGSLYSVLAPSQRVTRPAGEFNESRIVVNGRHVEHWLNGVKVVEYDAKAEANSPIALQNHNSNTWFKNLKIRPITPRQD